MRKHMRIIALSAALAAVLLLPAGLVRGQVGEDQLVHCQGFAYSTEEDFITQAPEPIDGNPVISDGDLLSPDGHICARNTDLLGRFDVFAQDDLGLDAADVIDVDTYLVALSTELDSPNTGQFTAGDLLVTNGAIIANEALTYLFNVGYDVGLDAVHFVGTKADIIAFLTEIQQFDRSYWLDNASTLSQVLARREVDILFSTEGTHWPMEGKRFLDGDLLSARDGIVVAENGDLMPTGVPADIRDGGVDFGLDAATTNRAGDIARVLYSTEILFRGEPNFTDGDVMQQLGSGVVRTNEDLIKPLEPRADFVGLDALSIAIGAPLPECFAEITQVGGMSTGSINSDGYANGPSIDLTFEAHDSPFGRSVKVMGLLPACDACDRFKLEYGAWSGPGFTVAPTTWHAITPTFNEWVVVSPWLESLVHREADGDWYDILCNPKSGGLFIPWNTSGLNGKYSLRLTIQDAGGIDHVSAPQVVMLDNIQPEAEMTLDTVPVCGDITGGITVTGQITATDLHFHGYQLRYESSAANGTLLQRTYTSLSDTGDVNQPFNWGTVGLPKCGYRLILRAWDRTIINNHRSHGDPGFGFQDIDQAYFCVRAQ